MLNKAVIDLGALKRNAQEVKKNLHTGVEFCAVVKADAYGHGAERVANALYKTANCFAVALLEEGVSLRYCGIDKPILCLSPFGEAETDRAVYCNLTATAYTAEHLKALNASAKKQGRIARVHIKFNSGMNRQGVDDLNELENLIKFSLTLDCVCVCGLYSHLSMPEKKKKLILQVNKFLLANNLIKGYNNKVTCHISASGGFLKGVQSDMVRIGLLLYGYKPFESDFVSVEPVMKIFAPIITRRYLRKGDCALYGNETAKRDMDISLIRYGYADGLFRREVCGQFNNRCMDLTAVESGLETEYGYPVMTNADILAKKYGTISYEILTKSAFRAEKIYVD